MTSWGGLLKDIAFLSTPSARRATFTATFAALCHIISIHALREEGDRSRPMTLSTSISFLSTPSARRATNPFAQN